MARYDAVLIFDDMIVRSYNAFMASKACQGQQSCVQSKQDDNIPDVSTDKLPSDSSEGYCS